MGEKGVFLVENWGGFVVDLFTGAKETGGRERGDYLLGVVVGGWGLVVDDDQFPDCDSDFCGEGEETG